MTEFALSFNVSASCNSIWSISEAKLMKQHFVHCTLCIVVCCTLCIVVHCALYAVSEVYSFENVNYFNKQDRVS